jgi:hypothetical protein
MMGQRTSQSTLLDFVEVDELGPAGAENTG